MLVTEVPFPLYIVISHADFPHKKNIIKENIFFQFSKEKHIMVKICSKNSKYQHFAVCQYLPKACLNIYVGFI